MLLVVCFMILNTMFDVNGNKYKMVRIKNNKCHAIGIDGVFSGISAKSGILHNMEVHCEAGRCCKIERKIELKREERSRLKADGHPAWFFLLRLLRRRPFLASVAVATAEDWPPGYPPVGIRCFAAKNRLKQRTPRASFHSARALCPAWCKVKFIPFGIENFGKYIPVLRRA
jgi:hypothetical protein